MWIRDISKSILLSHRNLKKIIIRKYALMPGAFKFPTNNSTEDKDAWVYRNDFCQISTSDKVRFTHIPLFSTGIPSFPGVDDDVRLKMSWTTQTFLTINSTLDNRHSIWEVIFVEASRNIHMYLHQIFIQIREEVDILNQFANEFPIKSTNIYSYLTISAGIKRESTE